MLRAGMSWLCGGEVVGGGVGKEAGAAWGIVAEAAASVALGEGAG